MAFEHERPGLGRTSGRLVLAVVGDDQNAPKGFRVVHSQQARDRGGNAVLFVVRRNDDVELGSRRAGGRSHRLSMGKEGQQREVGGPRQHGQRRNEECDIQEHHGDPCATDGGWTCGTRVKD
jgi:hypothetical protein